MNSVQQTLSIIKPDAVERNLESQIKELFRNKDSRKIIRAKEHSSYSSALKILKKDPFDRKAFEDLLDEQTKHSKSRQSSARVALVTQITRMTKEERLIYSERLEDLVHNKLK